MLVRIPNQSKKQQKPHDLYSRPDAATATLFLEKSFKFFLLTSAEVREKIKHKNILNTIFSLETS